MLWAVAFLILLVALMIPILAIVLDSPALRNILESRHGSKPRGLDELTQKVATLEDQVDELGRTVESLKEETQFLHQLLENPEQRPPSRRLSPPKT
ncbi:MAG: hypothetical protein HY560_06440 [Gemmatimonadetes bacterium]|nr:hypothetical protein [Gemmatimonadota bacterium]